MRESLLHHNPATTATKDTRPILLGTFGTLLQIFRLYMGTGLLAFPYAVKCGGLLLAPVALIVIGGLNNYTLRMLVHCKRKVTQDLAPAMPTTLDDLAFAAFGYGGRLFTSIAMVLALLGLCSGYLIFVGSTLRSSLGDPAWSSTTLAGYDINYCTVVATLLALPLTMIRNYNQVQWSGVLGNLSLAAAIVVVLYHVVQHIVSDATPSPPPSTPSTPSTPSASSASTPFVRLANVEELPVFLGLVFFAFAIQGVVLGVESVAAKPKNFLKLLDVGAVVGVGLYCCFGCLAYYAYGNDTTQIIFQSIASDNNSLDLRIVEVLFCGSMVLLYPMQLVPVVQIFERWLGIQHPHGRSVVATGGLAEDGRVGTAFSPWMNSAIDPTTGDRRLTSVAEGGLEDEDGGTEARMCRGVYCCQQNLLRVVLTLLTGSLAVVFGDVFSQILSIVGALGFSLLSFILPPLIYVQLFKHELTCLDICFSLCIFVLGVVGMGIATYIDGASIIAYFQGNSTDPCRSA